MHPRRALVPILAWAAASATACALATSGLPGSSGGAGPATGGSGPASSSSASTGSTGSGGQGGAPITCASAHCEAIPVGWTLVRARKMDPSSPPDAAAPTCAGGAPVTVLFHGPADAGCTPCSCGQPMGASCTAPEITCSYSTLDCSTNDLQVQESSGGCHFHLPPAGSNSNGSCKLTAPGKLTPGTCATSGGEVTPKDPWAGTVVLCPQVVSAGGCDTGESCVPAGETADGAVCIVGADASDCPAGWTADGTLAYDSGADGRTCSACSCNVVCQGGDYVAYDDDLCNDSYNVTVSSASCTQIPDLFDWSQASLYGHTATPMLKSCDGAVSKGAVTPAGPHRICCK